MVSTSDSDETQRSRLDGGSPRHDPRMVGFRSRTPVDRVLEILRERVPAPLPAETVSLREAAGRVLIADVTASVDVPGFDRAAMDGFAVNANDTHDASEETPVELNVIGTAWPGRAFDGTVTTGHAVRIMTGAPVPPGTTGVLRAELTRNPESHRVLAIGSVEENKHIGRRGEDIAAGTVILHAGRRLRPQDVGCLSSVGIPELSVIRQPTFEIFVTGNELLPPGSKPTGYQITDSNSPLLTALAERDGAKLHAVHTVADDRPALVEALSASRADVIVITGGSSVGQEDHVPSVVAELGTLAVHGIEARPAGPAGVGFVNLQTFFLLPGNPVACLAAYDFFVGPTLRRLGGRPEAWPHATVTLPLTADIVSAPHRTDYVRVRITEAGAEPSGASGASRLTSATEADGVVIVPSEADRIEAGSEVQVLLYSC